MTLITRISLYRENISAIGAIRGQNGLGTEKLCPLKIATESTKTTKPVQRQQFVTYVLLVANCRQRSR